jgi:IS30 family transposase
MTSLHERPAEIEEQLVPGRWEGDTIKGKYNRSAVGALVERSTLLTVLGRMDGGSADAALAGFGRVLDRIEAQERLSIPCDRGKEMAKPEELTAQTGVKVYFADPHAPWQRGTNENANGMIASICPKAGTSADTPRISLTSLPGCSTQGRANPSAGNAPLNSSSQTSTW